MALPSVGTTESIWLETAGGEQVFIHCPTADGTVPRARFSLGAGEKTWQAVVWRGGADRPEECHWLGTLCVRVDVPATDPTPFELVAEVVDGGDFRLRARLEDGRSASLTVWRGQRGRWERRRIRGADAFAPSSRGRRTGSDAKPADPWLGAAACPLCGLKTYTPDGRQETRDSSFCPACLRKTIRLMAICAARAGRTEKALAGLTHWFQVEDAQPEASWLAGLLKAHAGDFDGALAHTARLLDLPDIDVGIAISVARIHLKRAAQALADSQPLVALRELARAEQVAPATLQVDDPPEALREWRVLGHTRLGLVEDAIQVMEAGWLQNPTAYPSIHHLAGLYYRRACELERQTANNGGNTPTDFTPSRGHPANHYWRRTIAFWSTILHSSQFWSWWQTRFDTGSLSAADGDPVLRLRESIRQRIIRTLRDFAVHYRQSGSSVDADRLGRYEVLFSLEMETANLIERSLAGFSIEGWIPGFACGPLMLEMMTPTSTGQSLVAAIRRATSSLPAEDGQRLQRYLSPLGRYYYLLEQNQLDQAIAGLERVATSPQVKSLLGSALRRKASQLARAGRLEQAVDYLVRARENGADLDGDTGRIVVLSINRADELVGEGRRHDSAIRLLQGVHALVEGHPEVSERLARALLVKSRAESTAGRVEAALSLLRQARACAPANLEVVTFMAGILASERSFDEAERLLRESLAVNPRDPSLQAALAGLLVTRATGNGEGGHSRDNVRLLKEAVRLEGNHQARLRLAQAYRETERYPEAIRLLRSFLREDPDNVETKRILQTTMRQRGQKLADTGRYEQAAAYLRKSLTFHDDQATRDALAEYLNQRSNARD